MSAIFTFKRFLIFLFLLLIIPVYGAGESRHAIETDLDLYYSSIAWIYSFRGDALEPVEPGSEGEIYRTLLSHSYLPQSVLFEASVNPMPLAGVGVREYFPDFYNDLYVTDSFNVVRAVTAGLEEPYALSVFLGKIIVFNSPEVPEEDLEIEEEEEGDEVDEILERIRELRLQNRGYMGYLISVGNYHILLNELIEDNWIELEWKIKGERADSLRIWSWSFRTGVKLHENKDISSVGYISLARSRLDFDRSQLSLLANSGFEYIYEGRLIDGHWARQKFAIDRKWPFRSHRTAFVLKMGVLVDSPLRYNNSLRYLEENNYQIFVQPNIRF